MNEGFFEEIERLKDKLVVVEGKNDKIALEGLGVKDIVMLSKKPMYKVIEEVRDMGREVVILTDLDKEGKKLYGTLNSGLQQFGVRVNNRFRNFLFRRTKVRQVESLRNIYK